MGGGESATGRVEMMKVVKWDPNSRVYIAPGKLFATCNPDRMTARNARTYVRSAIKAGGKGFRRWPVLARWDDGMYRFKDGRFSMGLHPHVLGMSSAESHFVDIIILDIGGWKG